MKRTDISLNQILKLSDVSNELAHTFNTFDNLCDMLMELTEIENENYMLDAIVANTPISLQKVDLLEEFEVKAQDIFVLLKTEASDNLALQTYFIDKIQQLQSMLRVNTTLQLDAMSKIYGQLNGIKADQLCH